MSRRNDKSKRKADPSHYSQRRERVRNDSVTIKGESRPVTAIAQGGSETRGATRRRVRIVGEARQSGVQPPHSKKATAGSVTASVFMKGTHPSRTAQRMRQRADGEKSAPTKSGKAQVFGRRIPALQRRRSAPSTKGNSRSLTAFTTNVNGFGMTVWGRGQ